MSAPAGGTFPFAVGSRRWCTACKSVSGCCPSDGGPLSVGYTLHSSRSASRGRDQRNGGWRGSPRMKTAPSCCHHQWRLWLASQVDWVVAG